MKKFTLLLSVLALAACSTEEASNKTKPESEPDIVVSANDTCMRIDAYLASLEKERAFSGALLIVKNGKRIFSKGYGWADREKKIPFRPSTLASMGSITKAFTAAGILKLYEQQKLSLMDTLGKFFPSAPRDKSGITIHQLLTHSSGFSEFLEGDKGDYEIIDTKAYLERAFAAPLAFRPGEKAVYTNVGMSLLGIIIQEVSGMEYEAFLKKELLGPAGADGIGYHYPAQPGDTIAHGYAGNTDWGTHQSHFEAAGGGPYWNLKANGGLEASLNDIYAWSNALTNHTILKSETIGRMFSPIIAEDNMQDSYFGYGCNIGKTRRNTKMIDNGGSNRIYHARMIRLPEEGIVFYMVTNNKDINTNMVLPNVTQLYFLGKIETDATAQLFQNPQSEKIYRLLDESQVHDLDSALKKENLQPDDDMILLETGERLMDEGKYGSATVLFRYYTQRFPKIIIAWNSLGECLVQQGEITEARNCFHKALALSPDNKRAIENLHKLGN